METLKGIVHRDGLLREELAKTRHASLIASRNGDYRMVARLTKEAARLNQERSMADPFLFDLFRRTSDGNAVLQFLFVVSSVCVLVGQTRAQAIPQFLS